MISARRLIPKTKMGIFTAILVALWLIKLLVLAPGGGRMLTPGQQFSLDLLTLLLVVPLAYYIWRGFSLARRKLLWKIRRRLILAHIFIGAIPALLGLIIVGVAALLFYYQLTYYLISNQIGVHAGQIHAFGHSLSGLIESESISAAEAPGRMRSLLDREAQLVLGSYPTAAVVLQVRQDERGKPPLTLASGRVRSAGLGEYQVPAWAGRREFSGLVLEDAQPQIYAAYDEAGVRTPGRGLYLRSLVFSEISPDLEVSIEISVPLAGYLLERLKLAIGPDLLLTGSIPVSSFQIVHQTTEMLRGNIMSETSGLAVQKEIGTSLWSIVLFPVSWNSGAELDQPEMPVLFVELSLARLVRRMFQPENEVSRTILGVLQVVIGFFLVVELISLVVGVVLTRSITTAVYNLDRGTRFIKRGDFSHRILETSNDQLGALAASFNQMTEYIQTLVRERVQKERLERELEIAKEVQQQLFPRGVPQMPRMELSGICLPARVVSGDYYDFLPLGSHRIGFAVGDICGKGISAALLMANLQATLRTNATQIFGASGDGATGEDFRGLSSRIVGRINDQIFRHTSSNKFATLFFALYDDQRGILDYCNAGHNPPIFFSSGTFRRLSAGGTVVGIFPDAEYEEECLILSPGDLFLAYTDGIVECVNEYGEEFGETRLVEVVENHLARPAGEIQKAVIDRVLDWAFEEERDDDMTLIVGKLR